MQTAQQLQQQFAMTDTVSFETHESGIVLIKIHNDFAKAVISSYGAQILSYQPHEQNEVFFLSPKAVYGQGKAIRGGSPVCWPWFGDDTSGYGRPPHGFARNQQWQVIACQQTDNGETLVRLQLTETEGSLAVWPYYYDLQMEVLIGDKLQLTLTTTNTGKKPFQYTQALHSYFKVSDIDNVHITGLDNISYLDKVCDLKEKNQQGAITVEEEVDRVYTAISSPVVMHDSGTKTQLLIESHGSQTTIVWNPWQETIKSLTDMDQTAYRDFICIETANAANDVITLAEGESYALVARYRWQ